MKMKESKPKRNFAEISSRASVDAKLTQAALHLSYNFEQYVNFRERIITIAGDIDLDQFLRFDAALTELETQSKATVTIKINSGGGEVYQALAIIGRLKASKCKIVTEGYGEIMSSATMILAAGDKRRISKYSTFMHHESSYGLEGRHSNNVHMVRRYAHEEDLWAQWMEEFTGTEAKFWLKTGKAKDAYFNADQLHELGVVDEIF